MSQITLNNGDSGSTFRTNLNTMFTELFNTPPGSITEKQARSAGSPSTGDPATLTEITHTLSDSYSSTPEIILVNKSDWHVYVKTVSVLATVCTVVVGVGSYGSGNTCDYNIYAATVA